MLGVSGGLQSCTYTCIHSGECILKGKSSASTPRGSQSTFLTNIPSDLGPVDHTLGNAGYAKVLDI